MVKPPNLLFQFNTNNIIFLRMLLSNPSDPLSRAGGSMVRGVAANQPLAALQRNMPLSGANDTLPSGVALSFLESQITASCALQSPTEFRHWLLATVNHLLDKGRPTFYAFVLFLLCDISGPECRLRSILDELMMPACIKSMKVKSDTIFVSVIVSVF